MSMAITVVLPAPVATLSASRISSGLASRLALAGCLVGHDFPKPDHRLDRLDLAEEGPDAGEVVVPPVLEKPGGLGRHAPVGLGLLMARHWSTRRRSSLMIGVGSYRWRAWTAILGIKLPRVNICWLSVEAGRRRLARVKSASEAESLAAR